MNSIVSYPERGIGGKNNYRGNCSPKLIEDLYKQYGFSSISDYMCGSGTAEDVARSKKIKSSCYDLNRGFDVLNNDIKERNEFIFWHPPYWDIIKYSGNMYGDRPHVSDLSHIEDYRKFVEVMNVALMKQYGTLKTGGRMAILVGDIKKKGKLYSMILDMAKPGTIENIVIKAQHNCFSDRNNYAGKFIPIVHEYLLILRRDNAYIEKLLITKEVDFDIRDSYTITWKDVIAAVIEKANRPLSLKEIYEAVRYHRKAKNNNNIEAKVRQTLGQYSIFIKCSSGVYTLAA